MDVSSGVVVGVFFCVFLWGFREIVGLFFFFF